MIVTNIEYSKHFMRNLKKIPMEIVRVATEKEKIFKANPLHPSLKLHALKGDLLGLWSISVTMNYRIIFRRMDDGGVVFVSIGIHDIYKNL